MLKRETFKFKLDRLEFEALYFQYYANIALLFVIMEEKKTRPDTW